MTLSNAPGSFLHGRRVTMLAFTLSAAFHVCAWLATPYFIHAWREPVEMRFDAVLVPSQEPLATSVRTAKINSKPARRAAKSIVPRPVRRATPATDFAAPENAIAVDPTPETVAENTTIDTPATDEKTPPTAATTAEAPAPASVADAMLPPIADSAGQKEPDPPPPELPSRIAIAYRMSSSISDGVADYTWIREGGRFEIDSTMQATGFIVGNFVGVLRQVSRGLVTPTGLQPVSFQILRGDGAPDTADFLRTTNELKLTRAGEARLLPLPPLIQDMQSFLFQLAYDVPRMQRPDDRLEVLVTNARKVYRHRFQRVGIETVQTPSGPIPAIHLRSEAGDPEDTYEVWLAPDKYYLPVKIKFYAGRFLVEFIAASIRTTP